MAATQATQPRLSQLALCVFGLVVVWKLLSATPPVCVDLIGSELRVSNGRRVETFHLASPYLRVRLVGEVETPSWRLELERTDGTDLVLGEPTVRSAELHPVVLHHQAVAQRLRTQLQERSHR